MAPWPSSVRDAIVAFVSQPRTADEVVCRYGLPPRETRAYLRWLIRNGDLKRVGLNVYAPRDYAGPVPERRAVGRARHGAQREAIMAFVSRPRTIREIKAHLRPPGRNLSRHIREMARLGDLKRVAPGIYAPRDYAGPPPELWTIKRPRPGTQRAAIMRFVSQPRTIREVSEHLGYQVRTIGAQLVVLTRIGFLKRVAPGVYAPRDYAGPPPNHQKKTAP